MHRFFCEPQYISDQEINLSDPVELHHAINVLRHKNKDKIIAIDGAGGEFVCLISYLDKKSAKLKIIEKHIYKKEDFLPRITIACAVPKKSKIDFIVEKLTEIGVERIVLLNTERASVKLKENDKIIKRLRKIALASLKQSGNLFLPEVDFLDFKGLLELKQNDNFDLALLPNLEAGAIGIKEALSNKPFKNVLAAIGPEGDFSKNEIELAKKSGFISVSLGMLVLKVDTAVILTAGFINLFLSEVRLRTRRDLYADI